MEKRGFWNAVFTLVGVTVGAGIFALPFVVAKAGFLTGVLVLLVVGLLMLLVSLYLGEVILRTKGKHQLSGLAEVYFGKWGKRVMLFILIFSVYGALFGYTLGGGELLGALFGFKPELGSWIFFIVLALVLLFDLAVFARFEGFFTPLKILGAIVLSVALLPFARFENLVLFSWRSLLVPYGVVLFSYLGVSVLPEMSFELSERGKLKKAIIYGVLISGGVYVLYVAAMVGVFGLEQEEVSVLALGRVSPFFFMLGAVFGLLALSTAFVALGFALKENFALDFKRSEGVSWVYVMIVPAFLLAMHVGGFVKVLNVTGVVGGGLLLVMILMMHGVAQKSGKRVPEFVMNKNKLLKFGIGVLIVLGMVYELFL
ncbi:MAG TPA: aromatic amino acid transport family protein [Candidatus Nanoarchaeia archaeon]|nr:aromatic amino acid transport family protein [Candidatus Nanoarchaeia archaeon]